MAAKLCPAVYKSRGLDPQLCLLACSSSLLLTISDIIRYRHPAPKRRLPVEKWLSSCSA